ncbi:PP2C family protein-serine/threonine phosphatase [Nocardioides sp.]|uniref:PP2C family protein-serine/threonine phosphatase n=1 Tax=Nocardioides sp. TaxID=35761 RepID=UPI0027237FCA|nr:PP2C family protein-serine/threonine phosphatase [Nocardioides sp.]MDO9456404.1 PP2C family protein-serine/threonine phosphatase [Nocardioides sp.]
MPTLPHVAALLVGRASRRPPGELADAVAEVAREAWEAGDVALLLATHEQTELVPMPRTGRSGARQQAVAVDDGPAGRCFTRGESVVEGGTTWVPVTHRGDRLGVLVVEAEVEPLAGDLAALVDAVALHLAADRGYSDGVEVVRRTQEMAVGAELLGSIVPPLTYTDDRVALAAVMEPSYASGGDALDHAVEGEVLRAMILDATGHGFAASLVSAVGVAAYRSARRSGEDLLGAWTVMDRFVGDTGGDDRYATALLVELHLGTGRLTWLSAGHPAPVVVRAGGAVEVLEGDAAPPLGTGLGGAPDLAEEYLEPGDVLVLHTDGITEARGLDGRMLGLDGFLVVLRDELARGGLLAEKLRRIRLDLLARDDAWLSDDATVLLVEWSG